MSGRSRNIRPPDNRQLGLEYWAYAPPRSNYVPARRYQLNSIGRDPWRYYDDRFIGGSDNDLTRFPSASYPRAPTRYLLLDDNPESTTRTPIPNIPPTYYNHTPPHEASRLSEEEQTSAINKLRKQLYSPHMSNIVKRLGTKFNKYSENAQDDDDDGKRCSVCLEDFESKQFVMTTPCNHMFHEECIVPWMKSQGKCPVCRFVIYEKNHEMQQNMREADLMSVIRAFNRGF